MDVILHNILPFLAILLVLVVIHELGHFVTAKLAGVKVLEFGFGYPPRIWGVKRGDTEYTINALPLGGFVRLLGEEDPGDPRSLAAKPRWVRIVVLASGAVMNVVLAIFLLSLALMIPRQVDVSRASVSSVIPGSPAAEAGLKPGDTIFAVNGTDVQGVGDLGYQIRLNLGHTIDLKVRRQEGGNSQFIIVPVYARWAANPYTYHAAIGQVGAVAADEATPITLNVTSTDGFNTGSILTIDAGAPNEEVFEYCVENTSTLILMERALDGTSAAAHAAGSPIEHKVSQGPTGITIGPYYVAQQRVSEAERARLEKDLTPCEDKVPGFVSVPFSETQHSPPGTAVIDGTKRSWESLVLARNEIISRIKGGVGGSGGFKLTGPVGIAQLTGEVVEEAGWKSLMEFAALISMNLAVLNIMPLPMLDGGRVVFVLIEVARRGKRIAPEREAMVHFVGMIVLLSLVVVITFFDVARIFEGEGIIR